MSTATRFKTVAEEVPDAPEKVHHWLYIGSFDPKNPFDRADLISLTKYLDARGLDEKAVWLKRTRWHLFVAPEPDVLSVIEPLYATLASGEPLDPELRQAEADKYIEQEWSASGLMERLELLRQSAEPTGHLLEEDVPPGVSTLIYRSIEE